MEDTRKISRTVTAEQRIKILRDVMATPEFAKMAKEIEAMPPVERIKLLKRVECRKKRTRVRIADCPEPDIYIEPTPNVVFILGEIIFGIAVAAGIVLTAVVAVGTFSIDEVGDDIPQDAGVPPSGGVPDAGPQ